MTFTKFLLSSNSFCQVCFRISSKLDQPFLKSISENFVFEFDKKERVQVRIPALLKV